MSSITACARATTNNTVATIGANLQKIPNQITKTAGYTGQIVLVNYYSINTIDPAGMLQVKQLNAFEKSAVSGFPTVRIATAVDRVVTKS